MVKNSFDLPENLSEKYNNVVKIEGYSNKKELKALEQSSFFEISEQNISLPSNDELLKTFFKSKNYPKGYYKKALHLIKGLSNAK